MGMYDQEPTFEDHFQPGDRMVLMGLEYVGTITTRFGDAQKVRVSVITRESYPNRLVFSALGAGFANLAQRASAQDFPHVVQYVRVPLADGKDVKRFVRVDVSPADWKDGDDGPAIDLAGLAPEPVAPGIGGSTESPGF